MSCGDSFFCLRPPCDGPWMGVRHGAITLAKKCFDTFTRTPSIVAERSEARETNGKQTSELNSVGLKTPKSIKIFLIRTTPVMTSSQLIRLQRRLPPSWLAVSKNENMTLETVFCKLSDDIFFHFRFENFPFPVRLFCP